MNLFRILCGSLLLNILGSTSVFAQGWTPHSTGRAKEILNGNFQSCLEDGDAYTERIYEYRPAPSRPIAWEFHMGPHDEFGLFVGASGDLHLDHTSRLNLLRPAYHVFDVETMRGDRTWTALNLWINVVAAGGSREDCQSFYVLIERADLGQKSAHR